MSTQSETIYWVECEECGYSFPEHLTFRGAREAAEGEAGEMHGGRALHVVDGRDVCHDCTPEGKAEARERMIRLCQYSWGHDGVDPHVTAEYVGAMLDQGESPPVEPPPHLLRSGG